MNTQPTYMQISRIVDDLTPSDIEDVYRGRPGCGCGCRGTYGASLRKRINAIRDLQKRTGEIQATVDGDRLILAIEDDQRYLWVYLYPLAS